MKKITIEIDVDYNDRDEITLGEFNNIVANFKEQVDDIRFDLPGAQFINIRIKD